MLGVVACVLAVVCKRMQHLLECWKSCANGSNIVALRFGDHGIKEMLGVVGWKVWPVSNFTQHPTICNRVCKRTQHETSNNVGSCWPTMGNNVASVCSTKWLWRCMAAIFFSFRTYCDLLSSEIEMFIQLICQFEENVPWVLISNCHGSWS